jgi:glycine/D-amino acid oxidase-like deaminating enzyme/nitrite reductase/ring-hydroxylating ferredoxin subunit
MTAPPRARASAEPAAPPIASLWVDTTAPPEFGPLEHAASVDFAVIGAGITGLTTALLLKRAGASVAVLEGRQIGHGVSGYTTAKLTSLQGLIYTKLLSNFGEERARAYAAANEAGLAKIAEVVEALKADCDLRWKPNHTYAEDAADLPKVEREVQAAARAGLPVTFTTETDLPFPVAGAVRLGDQAEFHPVKYLSALARAVDGDGSHVFERSRATAVEAGNPSHVRTDTARLTADRVVVASHMPFLDRGLFFARLRPERSYVIAARLAATAPAGMYLSAERSAHSVRSHPVGGRDLTLIGGEGHKTGQADTDSRYRRLEAWASDHFEIESLVCRWASQDLMPADGMPYVGRVSPLSDRVLTATGFRKWGLTNGTAAAMMMSDTLLGRDNPWIQAFESNRIELRSSLPSIVKENANVGFHFFADRAHGGVPLSEPRLEPGQGRLVRGLIGQTATYRDDAGDLHRLSARCTHLGCIVRWNSAERTWDCPCHGSRFDPVDGGVIEGPAVHPLERKDAGSGPQD